MKYKKVGENKYKRVRSVFTGIILALLSVFIILLVFVINALIVLGAKL